MPVHVSIHDVSPAWSDEVEGALRLCHGAGVKPALLVIPNYHDRSPLFEDDRFCARLRALQESGHEIYLHGYSHRSRARYGKADLGGRLAWLFAQRVVSGGEAEMSDVSPDEGLARLVQGEEMLAAAGLRIDGFVAPAWSAPPWLLPILTARGYRFTEDHFHVHDPAGGRRRASVVLNWATRSPGRLVSSVAYCRAAKNARAFLPVRIAIHPSDMRFRLVRREVEHFLQWAQGDFVARGPDLLS